MVDSNKVFLSVSVVYLTTFQSIILFTSLHFLKTRCSSLLWTEEIAIDVKMQ